MVISNKPMKEIVKEEIENLLIKKEKFKYEYEIPHYSIWTDKEISYKGDMVKPLDWLLEKRMRSKIMDPSNLNWSPDASESEIKKREIWEENYKNYNTYKEEKSDRKEAQKFYAKQASIVSGGTDINNYYEMLGKIVLKYVNFWIYDLKLEKEFCEYRASAKPIAIYYDEPKVLEVETNRECRWFFGTDEEVEEREEKDIRVMDMDGTASSKKEFAKFVRKRLKKTDVIFPFKFNNYVNDNDEVIYEGIFPQIQKEMIHSTFLRNIFTRKTDYRNYPYIKMQKSFKYLLDKTEGKHTELNLYIIEKITKINLVLKFANYYEKIVAQVEPDDKREVEETLLFILDEINEMPNLIGRCSLVKEFMEPVLFWNEDIEKQLRIIGEILNSLKEIYKSIWQNFYKDKNVYDEWLKKIESWHWSPWDKKEVEKKGQKEKNDKTIRDKFLFYEYECPTQKNFSDLYTRVMKF